jgi:hypothetical protein
VSFAAAPPGRPAAVSSHAGAGSPSDDIMIMAK